jgi:dTDP-4-amino-4,6-dideoxygalactose transaminase
VILMNDFKAEPPELQKAMLDSVERVLQSGWYVLGNEVKSFESAWSQTCGVAHGIGVGNGMDALEIALRALSIGPGDEVITTPMTAFATVLGILRAGSQPVLADIDPTTALLSLESVQRCVTARTKAIVLVHLYGQVRSMDKWQKFCQQMNLTLIEDCAQAHLATWNGQVAGSFGLAGAYSFYPTKNLGAIGDGGMLVTGDGNLAERARRLRNYGQSVRYYHPDIGLNSRLDELQAAVLSARLNWLREFTERRQQIAEAYNQGINHTCVKKLTFPEEKSAHVYHLYVVTCSERDALHNHLNTHQIQSLIHYPVPVHHQIPCQDIPRDPDGLRYSERHANTCLSLPCHPQMTDHQVQSVINVVNCF